MTENSLHDQEDRSIETVESQRSQMANQLVAALRQTYEQKYSYYADPEQRERWIENEIATEVRHYEQITIPRFLRHYLLQVDEQGHEYMHTFRAELDDQKISRIELGRQHDPAHAIRISIKGIDDRLAGFSGAASLLSFWNKYCENYPDFFKPLKTKPGEYSICGFITPQPDFPLEDLLHMLHTEVLSGMQKVLDEYMDSIRVRSSYIEIGNPNIVAVISEEPEQGIGFFADPDVGLADLQPHTLVEACSTRGLTQAAQGTAYAIQLDSPTSKQTDQVKSEMYWVTAGDKEDDFSVIQGLKDRGLEHLIPPQLRDLTRVRENLVKAVDELGEPQVVPGKSGTSVLIRSLNAWCEQKKLQEEEKIARGENSFGKRMGEYEAQNRYGSLKRRGEIYHRTRLSDVPSGGEADKNEHKRQIETIVDIEKFKYSAFIPDLNLLHMLSPHWHDFLMSEGVAEFPLPAEILKIDISGMTRLAQESKVDPGEFVIKVLMRYIPYFNEVLGKQNYLTYLDGDAIVVAMIDFTNVERMNRNEWISGSNEPIERKRRLERAKQVIELSRKTGAAFPAIIEQVAQEYPEVQPLVDEIDVKLVNYMPLDTYFTPYAHEVGQSTLMLSYGGFFNMSTPVMAHAEHQAEKKAKVGQMTDTYIFNSPLTPEEQQELFGNIPYSYSETDDPEGSSFKARMYHAEMHTPVVEARMGDLVKKMAVVEPEKTAVIGEVWDVVQDISNLPEVREQLMDVSNVDISYAKNLLFVQLLRQQTPQMADIFWQTAVQTLNKTTTARLEVLQLLINDEVTESNNLSDVLKSDVGIVEAYQHLIAGYQTLYEQAA